MRNVEHSRRLTFILAVLFAAAMFMGTGPGILLGQHLTGDFNTSAVYLKKLFDIGSIGFFINVTVFSLVSMVTKRLDPARVNEFKSLIQGKISSSIQIPTQELAQQ